MPRCARPVLTAAVGMAMVCAGCWAASPAPAPTADAAGSSPAATAPAPTRARIHITGLPISINGFEQVPAGLFGVHAMRMSPALTADWGIELYRDVHAVPGGGPVIPARRPDLAGVRMTIDCQGDRYQPATVLHNRDYEKHFAELGRRYAQACKDADWPGIVEFWNEPYLNWATKPGINYDPQFYDLSKAEEDGPVTIKGWDKPVTYLRWRKALVAHDADGRPQRRVALPADVKEGQEFQVENPRARRPEDRVRRFTAKPAWTVRDPTQLSWWSGKQNLEYYLWMFLPYARAVKETNPRVTVVGGWGFHLFQERWQAWKTLYQPMIDASIAWLDGVHEHHYGGDTRMVAASYEVVAAYGMTRHGKWLRGYNTETGRHFDPAAPGMENFKDYDDALQRAMSSFTYHCRDVLYLLHHSPDKAASRACHGSLWDAWGAGGDEFFFKLLKDLRGRLVQTASDDPDLWPVASFHEGKLVVALHSDARQPRQITLRLDAPPGTELAPEGQWSWVEPDPQTRALVLKSRPESLAADPAFVSPGPGRLTTATLTATLRPRQPVKLVIPLKGEPAAGPRIARRQFFAGEILQPVPMPRAEGAAPAEAARDVVMAIGVDEAALAGAAAARLRLAVQGLQAGEGQVLVNGHAIPLPAVDCILEVPVPVDRLTRRNQLTFQLAQPTADGYQVNAASLVLDGPAR